MKNLDNITNNKTNFDCFTIKNNDIDAVLVSYLPKVVKAGGLCICLKGYCDVIIDHKQYKIQKGDLCSVFPHTMLQVKYTSDDFECYTLLASTDYMANLNISTPTMTYLFIKDNPCISISDSDIKLLINLGDNIKLKNSETSHPFRTEIVNNMILNILYEIVSIYQRFKPINIEPRTRKEIIFQKFLFSLAKNYKTERRVDFYSQEQFISTKYLSSVIKNASGKTAAEWIEDTVIQSAKNLLLSTVLTIQQISDELNFPNPSFFTQYFKKHTKMTPKQFRKS